MLHPARHCEQPPLRAMRVSLTASLCSLLSRSALRPRYLLQSLLVPVPASENGTCIAERLSSYPAAASSGFRDLAFVNF